MLAKPLPGLRLSPFRASALGLALSLASASLPATAFAAPEGEIDTETRAMEAYNDGKAAYDAGEYTKALKLFLEAQSLYPSPVFHYNIGLCHEAMENWESAVLSFEAYLSSYESAFGEEPEDKVNTQNKVDRIKKIIEAEELAAEAEARDDAKDPDPTPEPAPTPPPEPVDDQPAKPGRGLAITGGVLMGLGIGVAGIGGAVFGQQAADASSQLDAVYTGGNPERVTLAEAQALDEQGSSAQLNQILMLSIGGALAVTGVALLAVGLSKSSKAKKSGASASLIPSVGPQGAGLMIHGQF